MVQRDVLTHAAGHGDRVSRLEGFGLSLSRDVVHVRRMMALMSFVLVVRGLSCDGSPNRQSHDDRKSRSEVDSANEVGLLGHKSLLHFS